MKPRILFLLRTLELGGLEVVTTVLANKFVKEGHCVAIFSFLGGEHTIIERLDSKVKLYLGANYKDSTENVRRLREAIKDNGIDFIINQWGLPYTPINTARKAIKGMPVKIISVYHNAPSFNGKIQSVNNQLSQNKNLFKQIVLQIKKMIFRRITSRAMAYCYKQSDLYAILSASYKVEFERFTGVSDLHKLIVQTNPLTIGNGGYNYSYQNKQKEIIYIGRLNHVQKRVERVVEIWSGLENCFPDWNLSIVGTGDDEKILKDKVCGLNLKRVSFEGFKNPIDYYKRASLLVLTSDFEGFPLVLIECMSFGVVPVVYGTFNAVTDIIENNKNGIIIPKTNDGFFPKKNFEDYMAELMSDSNKLKEMQCDAIKKSKEYSLDKIYYQWQNTFESIRDKK